MKLQGLGRRVVKSAVMSWSVLMGCIGFTGAHADNIKPSSATEFAGQTINYLVYGSAGEPLQILNRPAVGAGLVTDVVKAIFQDSNYHITTTIKPIKRIKREMEHDQVSHWIAYALRSWRDEGVWGNTTFASVDLIDYGLSIGYKVNDAGFALEQLRGRHVVWIQGYKYPGALEFSERYGFGFLRAKNQISALKMVEAGRAPYLMENEARLRYFMATLGVPQHDYKFVSLDHEIAPTQITLLMSNDLGAQTHQFVNARLRELQAGGGLELLRQKYGLSFAAVQPTMVPFLSPSAGQGGEPFNTK